MAQTVANTKPRSQQHLVPSVALNSLIPRVLFTTSKENSGPVLSVGLYVPPHSYPSRQEILQLGKKMFVSYHFVCPARSKLVEILDSNNMLYLYFVDRAS
jgi:hypothetical protein